MFLEDDEKVTIYPKESGSFNKVIIEKGCLGTSEFKLESRVVINESTCRYLDGPDMQSVLNCLRDRYAKEVIRRNPQLQPQIEPGFYLVKTGNYDTSRERGMIEVFRESGSHQLWWRYVGEEMKAIKFNREEYADFFASAIKVERVK